MLIKFLYSSCTMNDQASHEESLSHLANTHGALRV